MRFMPELAGDMALRPIERVVVRLHGEGLAPADIGKKIRKKPGTVNRILEMVELKRGVAPNSRAGEQALRPVERVVLRLRGEGETYGQIGNRLARSGRRVQLIEQLAEFKLGG
jgi:DNA-binding CsgD family transcriptional regulator